MKNVCSTPAELNLIPSFFVLHVGGKLVLWGSLSVTDRRPVEGESRLSAAGIGSTPRDPELDKWKRIDGSVFFCLSEGSGCVSTRLNSWDIQSPKLAPGLMWAGAPRELFKQWPIKILGWGTKNKVSSFIMLLSDICYLKIWKKWEKGRLANVPHPRCP